MDAFPTGFLYLLLGVIVGALVLALIVYGLRQHRLHQLQNPHRDYAYHHKRG